MGINDSNYTLYEILNINSSASPQEVREAYLKAKSTYHKDSLAIYTLVTDEERGEALEKIEEAYAVLSNSEKRREYDNNYGFIQIKEKSAKIISIDRVPPMESSPNGDRLLIPPSTDFTLVETAQGNTSIEQSITGSDQGIIEISSANFQPHPEKRMAKISFSPVMQQEIQMETEWSGTFLRKVREACQVSLEEMSQITKVTKNYLLAIEQENYNKLPAPVYIRGFVTQMAKTLKLPHDKVAAAYLTRYYRSKMSAQQ